MQCPYLYHVLIWCFTQTTDDINVNAWMYFTTKPWCHYIGVMINFNDRMPVSMIICFTFDSFVFRKTNLRYVLRYHSKGQKRDTEHVFVICYCLFTYGFYSIFLNNERLNFKTYHVGILSSGSPSKNGIGLAALQLEIVQNIYLFLGTGCAELLVNRDRAKNRTQKEGRGCRARSGGSCSLG